MMRKEKKKVFLPLACCFNWQESPREENQSMSTKVDISLDTSWALSIFTSPLLSRFKGREAVLEAALPLQKSTLSLLQDVHSIWANLAFPSCRIPGLVSLALPLALLTHPPRRREREREWSEEEEGPRRRRAKRRK
jgi:hypothetical protein